MKAIATVDFLGVRDGDPRPVQIRKGDELFGDLARMAVAGGQAKEVDGKSAPENKAETAAPEKKAPKKGKK